MSRARSEHTDNLILIAATTLAILTAQRYFRTFAPEHHDPVAPEPRSPTASKSGDFTRELSQSWPRAARAQPVQHSLGGMERYSLAHL